VEDTNYDMNAEWSDRSLCETLQSELHMWSINIFSPSTAQLICNLINEDLQLQLLIPAAAKSREDTNGTHVTTFKPN
jgi:hypothetical protein